MRVWGVSERRLLLWGRLLVGAGFMYEGVLYVVEMRARADLLAANTAWQSWPLVGPMRPLELELWLAFAEFFVGVFLFGGLLTRVLGPAGLLVAGAQFVVLGLAGGLLNPLLALGSAVLTLRGGGAGTMDASLGKMQRRTRARSQEPESRSQ